MTRYSRDLAGDGNTLPAANWLGGAEIAVQIVLNDEEDGGNNTLHGDAASEMFLSKVMVPRPGKQSGNGTWK